MEDIQALHASDVPTVYRAGLGAKLAEAFGA
jgi:hypothetical protein